jgi:predicted GIY-YIG superfamily endonuclease
MRLVRCQPRRPQILRTLLKYMQTGIVYLIHLSEPMAHSQHYLGWTNQELPKRLEQHKKGNGARFTQVAVERGIKLLLVRVWAGTRKLERKFKNRKNARRFCPLCNEPAKVCMPRIKLTI